MSILKCKPAIPPRVRSIAKARSKSVIPGKRIPTHEATITTLPAATRTRAEGSEMEKRVGFKADVF